MIHLYLVHAKSWCRCSPSVADTCITDDSCQRCTDELVSRVTTASERDRLNGVKHILARRMSAVGQILVQEKVIKILQGGPWNVVRIANDRPVLVSTNGIVNDRWNLAHDGAWVALAMHDSESLGKLIGVDLVTFTFGEPFCCEATDSLIDDLSDAFSPAEMEIITNATATRTQECACYYRKWWTYALWSLKESYLKAIGVGIASPDLALHDISFTFVSEIFKKNCISAIGHMRGQRLNLNFTVRQPYKSKNEFVLVAIAHDGLLEDVEVSTCLMDPLVDN